MAQRGLVDEALVRYKYYFDGDKVTIVAEVVQTLDANGKLSVIKFTDYTAEQVRTLYPSSVEMRRRWSNLTELAVILDELAKRGIDFVHLAGVTEQPDADPFDLLCHVGYNAPIRTRRERANRVKVEESAFFNQFAAKAREVLTLLLDKYTDYGETQFALRDMLRVDPFTQYGTINEIARLFGGAEKLKSAVDELQNLLYAA